MTHFVVVQAVTKDAEVLGRYTSNAAAAVRKHGGIPIAGGSTREVLEENGAGAPATVLLSFPDAQSAHAWMADPDLAEMHALRRQGAHTTITLLPPM